MSADLHEAAAAELTLRELDGIEDCTACVQLQRETWGEAFAECVPVSLLMVVRRTGGILAGAWDDSEKSLLGFVFGLSGISPDGALYHWSHMLAVREEARGRGIGRALKLHQRELLLRRGITEAYWSYDPLVAQNAHINLNRLGAEALEYVVNMYGRNTGSRLHGSMGTDRLVVRWRLDSDRVRRAVTGRNDGRPNRRVASLSPDPSRVPCVLRRLADGSPRLAEPPERSDAVRLEMPVDLERLIDRRPDVAADWRRRSREAFRNYLNRGYRVVGFVREERGKGGSYVLVSGGSAHISSNIK